MAELFSWRQFEILSKHQAFDIDDAFGLDLPSLTLLDGIIDDW